LRSKAGVAAGDGGNGCLLTAVGRRHAGFATTNLAPNQDQSSTNERQLRAARGKQAT
jgi:hypothetical protein